MRCRKDLSQLRFGKKEFKVKATVGALCSVLFAGELQLEQYGDQRHVGHALGADEEAGGATGRI